MVRGRPLLSSSYLGYGVGSLGNDTQQLSVLLQYLRHALKIRRVVVCGHSTGCQNWLHFLTHADPGLCGMVVGVILQGAVSDRDYACSLPDTEHLLGVAEGMVGGGLGEELMPRAAGPGPTTAIRYLALTARLGEDDYFSSDLTLEEQRERVGSIVQPLLVVCSGSDEYVPSHVDQTSNGGRLLAAWGRTLDAGGDEGGPRGSMVVLEGADHALSQEQHQVAFVDHVAAFLHTVK